MGLRPSLPFLVLATYANNNNYGTYVVQVQMSEEDFAIPVLPSSLMSWKMSVLGPLDTCFRCRLVPEELLGEERWTSAS